MEPKRPFSNLDWAAAPKPVKQYIVHLEKTVFALVTKLEQLKKRIEKLEVPDSKFFS